jgi:hypothetical protein
MVAANVIRKVNRNEKLLKDQAQTEAYFFRFRMAMPQKYKKAIDMGTTRANKTINEALDIALRLQMTERDEEPASKTVDFEAAVFEPASMHDCLKILELEMKSLSTKIEGTLGAKEEKSQSKIGWDDRSSKIDRYESLTDRSRGRSESRDTRRDNQREYSSGRDGNRDFDRWRDRDRRFTKRRDDRRQDRFPSSSGSRDRRDSSRDFSRDRQGFG